MAIYTDRILRDIYRMVRKGSIQFEPNDRIPLTFRNQGKEMTLYLGSVYYDNNIHRVCYDLYNHKESPIPVGALAPRDIEKLSAGDLVAVANMLGEYENDSILRYSNYQGIEKSLQDSDAQKINFDETTKPRVLVNPELKPGGDQVGNGECRVRSLFIAKDECFVTVQNEKGEIRNVKLAMLDDRSIKNISSCLKNRTLETKVQDKVHLKTRIKPAIPHP